MKHLFVVLSLIVAVTVKAEELRSFLGISLGENIHQDKFMSFDKALKSKGIATSEIDPSIYAMFKEMYVCRLEKAFGSYDEAFVKANPNDRIYYVGILQFFKKEELKTVQAEFHAAERSILATYGGHGMKEITKQSNSALWGAIVNNLSSPTTEITARIFAFGNDAGDISQIISLCMARDTATGGGLFRVVAEDVALENDVKQDLRSHRAKVKGQSADQQENNVTPEPKKNAQLARAKALLANERAKKQAEEEARQQELNSFCGIKFGMVVNGEMHRTDEGRYLTRIVQLRIPFRGKETARIYASVKTRRVFRVVIENISKSDSWSIEEVVSKRYGVAPEKSLHHLTRDANYYWHFSNSTISLFGDHTGCRPDAWWEFSAPYFLSATNFRWKKIADQEFEQESGGDGSLVL